ncbi:MAG TPA: type II secretion system minor pseudopilin GspI [Methylibium sp.]|nr:type II secretion system minor pseudopilin GspI [Methylibium sp.]
MAGAERRRAAAGGMTLIEVLVALAVVAVTLSAGMKAAGALTGNAQRLVDVTAAQWCADNQLTALKLTRQFPGIGDSDFACEQLGIAYEGSLVIRPTPNPNFRRIDADIADADGRHVLTLSTIQSRY